VLYQGGRKDSGYKTRCNLCDKLTWYETEQPCHMDGCEGTLKVLTSKVWSTFSYPGRGTDQDADFSEWDMYELEDRVRLVREFDGLCDACVASFINFAKTHTAEDQEILVPKTVRVAVSLD